MSKNYLMCGVSGLVALLILGCDRLQVPSSPAALVPHSPSPSPVFGAQSMEEIKQLYLEAHRKRDVAPLRHVLDNPFAYEAILRRLFALDLTDVVIVPFKCRYDANFRLMGYERQSQLGLCSQGGDAKLILVGRRGGREVRYDPGIAIGNGNGKGPYCISMLEPVAVDAAISIETGNPQDFKPVVDTPQYLKDFHKRAEAWESANKRPPLE